MEDGIGGEGVGSGGAEVRHVRADLGGGGDVQVEVFDVLQLEGLADARQAVAQDHREVARVHDVAVGDLDVAVYVLVGQQHRGHQEGQGHFDGLAADLDRLRPLGGIVDVHDQMAALALQIFGRDLRAVQRVGDAHVYGQRLRGDALVADVVAVGVPEDGVAVGGEGHVLADVLDVRQAADVAKLRLPVAVVQMLADDDFIDFAGRVRQHIDHFLFILALRQRTGEHRGQQHRRGDDGGQNTLFHRDSTSFSAFTFIPSVVWRINPSQSISSAGRISSTHSMLTIAPRAISMHMELMMSMSE